MSQSHPSHSRSPRVANHPPHLLQHSPQARRRRARLPLPNLPYSSLPSQHQYRQFDDAFMPDFTRFLLKNVCQKRELPYLLLDRYQSYCYDSAGKWYVELKACITKLPENGFGSNMTSWPDRLHIPPDRLQTIEIDSYIARKELFKAESKYWNDIISGYVRAYHWKKLRLRNVMDMRAGYGGFGAAIVDSGIDAWAMNVVPTSGPNTLPVIYDRGLIGVMHDWCEPSPQVAARASAELFAFIPSPQEYSTAATKTMPVASPTKLLQHHCLVRQPHAGDHLRSSLSPWLLPISPKRYF